MLSTHPAAWVRSFVATANRITRRKFRAARLTRLARPFLKAAALTGAVGLLGTSNASAAVNDWLSTTAAALWDSGTNWSLNAEPGTGDDATFGQATAVTITLTAGEPANSLAFTTTGYVLGAAAGGGDLTLTSGSVSVGGGLTASIASQLKGTTGLNVSGGALALTNTTTNATNNTFSDGISVTGGSTLAFSVDAALGRPRATTSPSTGGR